MKTLRCAIYTRKSTEEGLEQGFNSLHAQREACSAYILSQAGEGWAKIETVYDDGGYSGGSMERPGLQALMADIAKGRIDVAVVYKVDRLTRSLADFARIVELFDQKGVSFVSVTQAFNTTTSMGRLTLNVLLSFAQFEREVTGERIRDKIAASKKKGLWMGGRPPLGYDGVERKLVPNPAEADVVRSIFRRYLELGSVVALEGDLKARGVVSKRWVNRKGQMVGGGAFSRGALYWLLSNPVYRGGIRHGKIVYPDAHPAIIDQDCWDTVQAKLNANGPDLPDTEKVADPLLLEGLLLDARGVPMVPIHANRRGRRYRYYIARDLRRGGVGPRTSRIALGVIEDFIRGVVPLKLRPDFLPDAHPDERLKVALMCVQLGEEAVQVRLKPEAISHLIPDRTTVFEDGMELSVPIQLKHRQGAVIIETSDAAIIAGRIDRALVRAIALARTWADRLACGEATSLNELASADGYCRHYAARMLPLAWLAPDLVEMILAGRQRGAVSLAALTRTPLPLGWDAQRAMFARCGS